VLALVGGAPFVPPTPFGRIVIGAITTFVVIAAVAAVGRTAISFTVLASTGFGDIVPLSRQARAICVVEQLAGALFLAILIARPAGVYPPSRGE